MRADIVLLFLFPGQFYFYSRLWTHWLSYNQNTVNTVGPNVYSNYFKGDSVGPQMGFKAGHHWDLDNYLRDVKNIQLEPLINFHR